MSEVPKNLDNILKPGDLVQLKSGGPAMTVRAASGRLDTPGGVEMHGVICEWFPSDTSGLGQGNSFSGGPHAYAFASDQLRKLPA